MIFFVHIGKTAGSTVNSYLEQYGGRGYAHCEGFINSPDLWKQRVKSADWLSGHVNLPTARQRLEGLGRDVRYYTCIREPFSQVRSHYNWLAEIHSKGSTFYNNHPEVIKRISERVRATLEAPTPQKIVNDLREFGGLFLNYQSRFFLGNNLARGFEPRLKEISKLFSGICTHKSIDRLIPIMSGEEANIPARFENVSRYHFDRALFETDHVQDFLREANANDEFLFRYISARMRDGIWTRCEEPAPS